MANPLQYLQDVLRGPRTPPKIVEDWDYNELVRSTHFQRLFDYYVGSEADVKKYVQQAMSRSFSPKTIEKMQLPYYPLVRMVIDRLAMVYKEPAIRYLDKKTADKNYQKLLEGSNINRQCKLWHRFAKLLDTVYVKPTWRRGHLEYDIFPPHLILVKEDPEDFLRAAEVRYNESRGGETYHVIWTDEEHWVRKKSGEAPPELNPWKGVNRYGVLPMIPLRLRETENHFGEGDTQLVDMAEKINILLASTYFNAIMQSHGQAVAVNFDFQEGEEILMGPDKIIQVKDVTKDMVIPDFKFVHPQPSVKDSMEAIDRMIKTAAVMRGLPASSVSIEGGVESGSARAIAHWALLELRADDIEFLRPFEKELFEISRRVWNFHSPDKIDEAQFGVDFPEPRAPVEELQELEAKQIKYKFGLWTPVDDMIDEDEGIDEAKAIEIIKHNLETRKELTEINDPFKEAREASGPPSNDDSGVGPRNWTAADKRRDSRGYYPQQSRHRENQG